MARWLDGLGADVVSIEATGVYWKPVYHGLENHSWDLQLVNAFHVKNVPGRKTDVSDARWLADVTAHGMVRASFVPPPDIRALRELTRYRRAETRVRAAEIQRLEKVLQDAGIKLTSVASRVWSKSSREMIEALIDGQTDPTVLAELAKIRMRPKIPALTEALQSHWAEHHRVVARAILGHIDQLDATIDALTTEIGIRLEPYNGLVVLWSTIPGVNTRTAEIMIAETGGDMNKFPTAKHLAAWAGVAPGSRESAGKHRPARSRHGATHLRQALIEAAKAASRTKDTFLSARYRRVASRSGPNRATVAVANSIICAAWHIAATGQPYEDLGGDCYTKRGNEKALRRHLTAVETVGYTITRN